jgi:ABC-type multidrug transport system ATPase subunit
MPAPPATIRVEAVSKHYGRQLAVDRLTFTVEAAQICALLGPNGAGKTSTMRMLVGLAFTLVEGRSVSCSCPGRRTGRCRRAGRRPLRRGRVYGPRRP